MASACLVEPSLFDKHHVEMFDPALSGILGGTPQNATSS